MGAKILKSNKKVGNMALKLRRPLTSGLRKGKISNSCYLIDI